MAARADVTVEELQLLKEGTRMFTLEDNLEAFSDGEGKKYMPYSAVQMADFMVGVGFIPEAPPLEPVLDDQFVQALVAE